MCTKNIEESQEVDRQNEPKKIDTNNEIALSIAEIMRKNQDDSIKRWWTAWTNPRWVPL